MLKLKKDNEPIEDIVKKEEQYTEEYYFRILNKNREILLYDAISTTSADIVVSKIKAMNLLDSKKPITLEINSPGGDVSAGFTIINVIEHSKAPIHIVVSGEAASMAALIAITGKKRRIYPNSYIMFHPLSEGQMDYLQYIKDRVKFLIQLENCMNKLCKKYTKLNNMDMHRMAAGELWLNADLCLKKGVVDEIIK